MTQFVFSIASFFVAISVLVAVHEFGHFWVARKLGFKVLKFSIGFGRPLWVYKGRDDMEFMISVIPLGGYIKMLDEREGPVAPEELHRAYNRKPVASRLAVLSAGPAFNFLFAVVAYWLLFVIGIDGLKPVIGDVAADSPAAAAGMERGDLITAIGDQEIKSWGQVPLSLIEVLLDSGDIPMSVIGADGYPRSLSIDVRGRENELSDPALLFSGLGFNRWFPLIAPLLDEITPGGAAEQAGLKPGDLVVSADDVPVDDWRSWVEFVRARPGEKISMQIERDGQRLALPMTIARPLSLRIRTLTPVVLPPGWYVYAGNARGRSGIRARVKRHLRRGKSPHWHVDHLTEAAEAMPALAFAGGHECTLVQALLARPRFHAPVPGFGSTDCRVCPAHLLTVRRSRP